MRHQWLVGVSAALLPLSVSTSALAQSGWSADSKSPALVQSAWTAETTPPALVQSAWTADSKPRALLQSPWAEDSKSTALRWELSYLALSAIDTGQTIDCLQRDMCEEANPLFGKHPKPLELIAAKVALGAAHFVVFDHLNDRNSHAALRFAQGSVLIQGGVVLLNARFTIR